MCRGPKIKDWKANSEGCRHVDEAVSLLAQNDIILPSYVRLIAYDGPELSRQVPAAYLLPSRFVPGALVTWDGLLLNRYGEVVIKVRPSVFESDEAIIAVISHELFELELLKQHFAENGICSATQIANLISTETSYKNFHCRAWQHGDQAVLRFRGRKP